jgi:hypothetical protein
MFNKLKSAAMAVLVASAVAVAAMPIVTVDAVAQTAAPAKPAVKASKADPCKKIKDKKSAEYKDCRAKNPLPAKKMAPK